MKNHWQLMIVIAFFLLACTSRHVVVLPEDAKDLSDKQWKILQEPLPKVESPATIENEG